MAATQGLPVLILKEGASRSRGKDAQHANIMAAKIISEAVRSSLGPKGMDKMLVDSLGDVTSDTLFSIESQAGGSWLDNVYTSENPGTWIVTGTYKDKSDSAELIVSAKEEQEEEEREYFVVDFLTKVTSEPISSYGRLLDVLRASSPDNESLLEMRKDKSVCIG